ncbi:MAG TPA: hypothetical protein VI796_00600 [Candidatus Thermoplasmatota archaeon]|nr:hypothetical protein [Candidatus Thermoplasmatota archaeon]
MAVEPVPFQAGEASETAALLLAAGTAAYALLTGYYAWRAFRVKLEDRWSALLATGVMLAMALLLYRDGATLVPAPFSVAIVVVYVGAIVVTLTFTLGRYQEKIERFKEVFGRRLNAILQDLRPAERKTELHRIQAEMQLGHEGRRKAPHLMMSAFLLLYGALGYLAVRGLWSLVGGGPGSGESLRNLYEASHHGWLAAGHLFAVFGLFTVLLVILPTELLRLRYPETSYPFKAIILSRLRTREAGLFGAHYYIAATVPLAVLWLTRDAAHWDTGIPAVFAMLAVSIFADTASALVGIRFGRRKWFHNPNKSYLGSVGGTLVAFAVALPFVGLPVAVASALVFLLVDVLAPVPFAVSDNILNPLALAATYTLLHGQLDPMLPYY